ncbi:hypothetical protein PQC34_gp074 [Cronobacter phage A24]|uniref:Uncharacterized protein n=1 Tax=Cronobacter phage A24 TaxID=2795745 RepID=A0A7T5UF00_9CAUD|nr:hypothetical protein PQC34_gp074 [Cronobacter phage A24]QQG33660.1 hypothetical protein [Cronobacter phage A24]
MVNLSLITKIEEFDEFFRIYLVSGDIEEIEHDSFMSALNASETGYFKYQVQAKEVNTAMMGISDDDIEDMTNLSSVEVVPESALSDGNTGNAYAEGSSAVDVRDVINNMSKDELIALLSKLQK